jgi:hypothetical protein
MSIEANPMENKIIRMGINQKLPISSSHKNLNFPINSKCKVFDSY